MPKNSQRTASTISRKTKETLSAALDDLLTKLQVVRCFPDSSQHREIFDFARLLAQQDPWKSQIAPIDLFDILGMHAKRFGLAEFGDELVLVKAKLEDAQFQRFKHEVCSYLLSLPRKYEVSIDLPLMPTWGAGEIKLTQNISLVQKQIEAETGIAQLAHTLAKGGPLVSLKIDCSGYASWRIDSTAVSSAISQMKQFFQMFRSLALFKETWAVQLLRWHIVSCRVTDPEFPDEVLTIELQAQLSGFLSRVRIDEDRLRHYEPKRLISGVDRKAETPDEKSNALKSNITWISKVMDCPTSWLDANRIRTALEWAFDSAVNDNQTFAFIQACIGLEALIGDDDKDEPLTTRLADRCAYLLGKNHKDRSEIRNRFKQMYGVRSKLIHGRTPRLNLSDEQELRYAQTTLDEVITAEAAMLLRALDKAEQKP